MTSSHRDVTKNEGIIRGAKVDGVIFCNPTGQSASKATLVAEEKENMKALEDYWYKKGLEEGKKAGYQEGFQKGEEQGFQKGSQEGEEKGRAEGLEEGREKGVSEGKESFLEEGRAAVRSAETLAQSLKMEMRRVMEEIKPELIRFSMVVCESLLKHTLQNPEHLTNLIDQVLDAAQSIIVDQSLSIVLSPEDHKRVDPFIQDVVKNHADLDHISLIADQSLPEGVFRVESTLGLIKWDIHRQLEQIETSVLEAQHQESDSKKEGGDSSLLSPPPEESSSHEH